MMNENSNINKKRLIVLRFLVFVVTTLTIHNKDSMFYNVATVDGSQIVLNCTVIYRIVCILVS